MTTVKTLASWTSQWSCNDDHAKKRLQKGREMETVF